jgi:hypothetical protein
MYLIGLAIIVWGSTALYGHFNKTAQELRAQHEQDLDTRTALRIELRRAETTIRSIANGSGNPQIEAQIYLDETTYSKEIV